MIKRLSVLALSCGAIIAFGYALGGLGSYAMGVPKPVPIALGLLCGSVASVVALRIWKTYLADIEREDKLSAAAAEAKEFSERAEEETEEKESDDEASELKNDSCDKTD